MGRPHRVLVSLAAVAAITQGSFAAAHAASAPARFSKSVTVTRLFVKGGADVPVDTRTVTVRVDRTTGLRDRDGLQVTWTGAHPTGGIYGDIHGASAIAEEYPMVLLQCRGIDSANVPAAQQLTPQSCFTQTPSERFVSNNDDPWGEWRMDRYASQTDLGQHSGAPTPFPATCPKPYSTGSSHNVPFVAASGSAYAIGEGGCAGTAPEMSSLATTGLPSNTVYGVTNAAGNGDVRFDVRSSDSNASLGCSDTVPCALVAVPIIGVSCDLDFSNLPAADRPTDATTTSAVRSRCSGTGSFSPGQPASAKGGYDRTVSGRLWWAASNWRGRITVPLSFAPSSKACDVVGGAAPTYLYGSELMIQAMTSWGPHFCLDRKLFPVRHVQTGEPQARHLLRNGTISAALGSNPPASPYPMPVVTSPVAMTGFSIGFAVDDKNQLPVARLNLTPRLLAKLLTESYPATNDVRAKYAALSHNPLDIRVDPEFVALNPNQVTDPAGISGATLFALSSDSDVMWSLTAYLNADPDARAFLDGSPDPWGMVVNPRYKGISLPTDGWPLKDDYVISPPPNDCLRDNPVPFLNLIAAPTQRIPNISLALQYAISPSPTTATCVVTDTGVGNKMVPSGPQVGGHRFLLGVTSIPDAERFGLAQASLLTHTASGAPSKFTDSTGRTFVAPSDASLGAAAQLLSIDKASNSWSIDPAALRAAPSGAKAYPGAMLVSATVPTSGLTTDQAARYASFLSWAATTGQVRGVQQGQLPAGYLPMTARNGLAGQAAYAVRAAEAIRAQRGAAVPLIAPTTAPSVGPWRPGPATSVPEPGPAPGAGPTADGSPLPPSSGPLVPQSSRGTVSANRQNRPIVPVVAVGRTQGAALGGLANALPLALFAGLLAASVALPGLFVRRRPPG